MKFSEFQKSFPEIIKLYEKYHSAGFNIYGAGIDADESLWKKFVASHKMPWVNVNVNPSNPALEKYYIQATPSMILIDSKGLIAERFMDVKDLQNYLSKSFK